MVLLQLFPDLFVKLCDFGLARFKEHSTVTWMGQGVGGTISYMAPEVLVGVPGRGRMMPQPCADVWAMCTTAVEWFTAQPPWTFTKGVNQREQVKNKQKAKQLPDQLHTIPTKVADVLRAGLDYDYRKRPPAAEMRDMLGR
eukprot:GHVT01101035.1.p1 GENE.GHVT01101035.1~~GHVT01101035.1.p1  ORF type:complete len:141 (-),score=0.78 GHVT01101035.1:964-1386(-)